MVNKIQENQESGQNKAPENAAQMAREIYRLAGLGVEKVTGALEVVDENETSKKFAERNQQEEYALRTSELQEPTHKIDFWQRLNYVV
jgi:hypothetical protein